ncbi:MAG: Gfo/Idh/MocA family oxidoreductase [Pseudomonadota bacterium]
MRVVLVGLGMVARTHIAAIQGLEGQVVLHGVLARDAGRAERFLEECLPDMTARPQIYTDVADVAQDSDVDMVILATPPDARVELVASLAGAGKHILMEKPIERDLQTATGIIASCEAANVALGVCFQHRMRSDVARLKAHLESGAIGQLSHVDVRVPWWRDQSYYDAPGRGTYARDGGGVLMTQAIHSLDLTLMLAGPISMVQAMQATTKAHTMEAEDWAAAAVEFRSGAVGSIMTTTAAFPGSEESLSFYGTKGAAHLRPGQLVLIDGHGQQEAHGSVAGSGGGADPMAFDSSWHRDLIADFCNAVRTGTRPAVSGRDALQVHALIDAMARAARSGRRIELS